MATYDTDGLIIETTGTANVLPAPGTYPQRDHILVNSGSANVTWTALGGGNPFSVGGVASASLVIPPGQSRQVQSTGALWVVAPTGARRIFAGSAVSDASGNAVFTFTPAFASVPKVAQAIETATADATEARVTALTVSSCTLTARRSPAVTVLGISVLSASVPLVGATLHLIAAEAGQGT